MPWQMSRDPNLIKQQIAKAQETNRLLDVSRINEAGFGSIIVPRPKTNRGHKLVIGDFLTDKVESLQIILTILGEDPDPYVFKFEELQAQKEAELSASTLKFGELVIAPTDQRRINLLKSLNLASQTNRLLDVSSFHLDGKVKVVPRPKTDRGAKIVVDEFISNNLQALQEFLNVLAIPSQSLITEFETKMRAKQSVIEVKLTEPEPGGLTKFAGKS